MVHNPTTRKENFMSFTKLFLLLIAFANQMYHENRQPCIIYIYIYPKVDDR